MTSSADVAPNQGESESAERVPASAEVQLRGIVFAAVVACCLDLLAGSAFSTDVMYIVRPLLYTVAAFCLFTFLLAVRTRTAVFSELGFIYLSLALAYTVLPGLTMLALDFFFPLLIDGQNIIDLAPTPAELGDHFWRHLLFIGGVALGYVWWRGGPLPSSPPEEDESERGHGSLIVLWLVLIVGSWTVINYLSAPVATYLDHYTRFDHLNWFERRIIYMCMTLKSGGYFMLLALLFTQYRRWRAIILIVVPLICVYEGVFSFGQRIETLTILLATVGFYQCRVAPISLRKGVAYMVALALLFSGIGLFRASGYDFRITSSAVTQEGGEQFAEFGAVYNTGFHLYSLRAQHSLPPRPPLMFVSELVALVPFVDHESNNPMYWYAKYYFPEAAVPPQTMGVIADSAIWGGEWDLLVRSLLNGAVFALLTRWFLRRRERWLRTNIYVFACATCVLTLKYSVFYQIVPFTRLIVPVLLITAAADWGFRKWNRVVDGAVTP